MVLLRKPCKKIMAMKNLFNAFEALFVWEFLLHFVWSITGGMGQLGPCVVHV